MARDEAMLMSTGRSGQRCLRFYGWSRPTLSLGYFQKQAAREGHAPSRGCDLVRRATGGGAILHDRELTYSFAAPILDHLTSRATQLYDAFHESLLDTLASWGITASLVGQSSSPDRPATSLDSPAPSTDRVPPFLCFERRSPRDVVLDGEKIAGSAQRRHHGAVLQHGSVLLRRSEFAPELPGVCDLAQRDIQADEFVARWCNALTQKLHLSMCASTWNEGELQGARRAVDQRYASDAWTSRR